MGYVACVEILQGSAMTITVSTIEPATDEEIAEFLRECREWAYVPTQCSFPLSLILRLRKLEPDAPWAKP